MPLYIAQSGDLEGCHACLTDRLTTLKDRATQLLIKFKTGALVTQFIDCSSTGPKKSDERVVCNMCGNKCFPMKDFVVFILDSYHQCYDKRLSLFENHLTL